MKNRIDELEYKVLRTDEEEDELIFKRHKYNEYEIGFTYENSTSLFKNLYPHKRFIDGFTCNIPDCKYCNPTE